MALFESLVEDARFRFDLGEKSGLLLSALLALITDRNRGGFAGFLDRFAAAGLGDTVSSWVSSGPNAAITREQTEAALGPVTLDDIAGQTGLDYDTTLSASAFMLPHIVNELTPDGAAPADEELHAKIHGPTPETIEAPAETFDRIGTAAVGSIEEKGENATEDFDEKGSGLERILPLIILLLLLIIGYWFCSGSGGGGGGGH